MIARNPEENTSLPYLLILPLASGSVVVKARETWPRTSKVYCHHAVELPDELDIVERVPVRSCVRRGASIDLILDRARENRSQFVFAKARGRDVIFWQTARVSKQARPAGSVPTARASGQQLEILVDSHEQYAWNFKAQQATTAKRPLPAGDYAVQVDGQIVAAIERKSLVDLISTLTSGKLRYALADLAALPRAALVIEDRWSSVFSYKHVRPSVIADGLAECQVRFPTVPIVFTETRGLAQEWSYRFFGAAVAHYQTLERSDVLEAAIPRSAPLPAREPTTPEVRAWALATGLAVAKGGKLRPEIWDAYAEAMSPGSAPVAVIEVAEGV